MQRPHRVERRRDVDLVVGDYGGVAIYVGRSRHGLVFLHRILAALVYMAAPGKDARI
jgi:hypothetical protein